MPPSKAQREATAKRRAKAVALRDAGVEWAQIAETLGYAGAAAACRDVQRAHTAQVEPAAVAREQELRRLDRLQRGVWSAAVGGDVKAADIVLRVIGARSRLRTPDVTTVATTDDRRQALEAIRDHVAGELGRAEGRDVAILARELREVIRELDSLPPAGRESPLDRIAGAVADDLAVRRAARRADAAGS